MRLRTVGSAMALALLGVAGGVGVGTMLQDDPTTIATASPVPAESPSVPVNEYDVNDDPGLAPLGTDLPLHEETFHLNRLRLAASVPDGWRRVELQTGGAWNFAPPDTPLNSYVLRIEIVAGARASVSAAKSFRILKLQNAVADGNLQRLIIESETDNGFVADYLDPVMDVTGHPDPTKGFYQRLTMERWLTFGGDTTAYADIAVTGRERDREGMADLLERVAASTFIPPPPDRKKG
jgi:hypothetical protein